MWSGTSQTQAGVQQQSEEELMDDYSYSQAYAEGQAELRESAAQASAARRDERQRKGSSAGVPGGRVTPWWRALGSMSALGR